MMRCVAIPKLGVSHNLIHWCDIMRVTFIAPVTDMSGGARVIHVHAKLLRERGHQVCVVARPRALSYPHRMRSLVTGRGWPTHVSVASYFDGASYEFRLVDHRRPIGPADVPDADVVIATWWETAEWVAKFPHAKGRKVHFVQGYEAFENMPKDRVDAVLRLPTFKITISKWLDEMLRHRFENRNVAIVPNGVDRNQFDAPPRGRQKYPTVGTVYSKAALKDCRAGLRAFDILRRSFPDVRLVTFGSTSPGLALPLPRGASHTVLPPQDRIRDIYASCDAWFCSSKTEGFGLPILEAMACRCPVVSTSSGGPMDLIDDQVNGFLVPVGDAEAIADRLSRVLSLPEAAWRTMSDAAYRTATSYSWNDAGDRFEAALLEAATLGANPHPRRSARAH
jgi:glycosyltransferase involved in cell wall biosynthesis